MRKWIWSGLGLMVFSCAAMYLAAQHAAENPNSYAARFFRGASSVGMRCNPLLAIGQATLPEMPRPVDKPTCQPLCILPDPAQMAQEDPITNLPGGFRNDVVAPEAPTVSEPIVVESEPPPPPGAENPAYQEQATVPPDDAAPTYPQPGYGVYPLPNASEGDGSYAAPVTSGDDEQSVPQPADQPADYESSDEEGPSMPYVADDADEFEDTCCEDTCDNCDGACGACRKCGSGCAKMGCCCSCGMLRVIKIMCCGDDCPECAKMTKTLGDIVADYLTQLAGQEEAVTETTSENTQPANASEAIEDAPADTAETPSTDTPSTDAPPSEESPMTPTDTTEPQEPGAGPDHHPAREDPHYHHHYPSCPYTGRCPYPYHYNIPRVDPVQRPPTSETVPAETHAEEQQTNEPKPSSKPIKKKKKFLFLFIGEAVSDCDCQQDGVDTMECRPSDLHGKVRSPF